MGGILSEKTSLMRTKALDFVFVCVLGVTLSIPGPNTSCHEIFNAFLQPLQLNARIIEKLTPYRVPSVSFSVQASQSARHLKPYNTSGKKRLNKPRN
jgi:hypothetical protein